MKKLLYLLFCTGLAAALTGCPANPPGASLAEIGNSRDYPEQAAGFRRGDVTDYQQDDRAGPADISIGYNMWAPDVRIVSTIYVTSVPKIYPELVGLVEPERAIYEEHKSAIVQGHASATLLRETTETLTKFGRTYTALVAAYRFDEVFMGVRQPVYSVLMVWRHDENIVKLRSTMPFAQSRLLRPRNLKLLDAVNWTVFPQPVTAGTIEAFSYPSGRPPIL